MYKTALVNTDIADGRRVVEELGKLMNVIAAFWYRREEEEQGKLVVVTSDLVNNGPISLYTKIAVMLNSLSVDAKSPVQMSLSRITLTDPHNPTYLRIKESGGALDDVYIYKMA